MPELVEKDALKQLIAYADAMVVEERRERQARFDAEHPEYEGAVQAAEPMDSPVRTYIYWRVRWSNDLGLPNARQALRGTA